MNQFLACSLLVVVVGVATVSSRSEWNPSPSGHHHHRRQGAQARDMLTSFGAPRNIRRGSMMGPRPFMGPLGGAGPAVAGARAFIYAPIRIPNDVEYKKKAKSIKVRIDDDGHGQFLTLSFF